MCVQLRSANYLIEEYDDDDDLMKAYRFQILQQNDAQSCWWFSISFTDPVTFIWPCLISDDLEEFRRPSSHRYDWLRAIFDDFISDLW